MEMICRKKDECVADCRLKLPHKYNGGCDAKCIDRLGILNATCQPVPTDLFDPLRPPRALRPGMCLDYPTCHLIGMILDKDCLSEQKDEAIARVCRRCKRLWPAKPHGVLFAGKARDVMDYLGSLDEKEWEAMMHRGVSIREAKNLKADALRVQEDANGEGVMEMEYKAEVRAIIHGEYLTQLNKTYTPAFGPNFMDKAAARIAKLPRP